MKKIAVILGLVLMSLTVHATSLNDIRVENSEQIDKASKDILACIALKISPNILANFNEDKQATIVSWFKNNCSNVSEGKSLNEIRSELGY